MGSKQIDRWPEKWEFVRNLSAGGQGTTRVVRRIGSPNADEQFVLKTLNDPRTPERRRRMYFEGTALKAIEHPGVARFVDSNAEQFADESVKLYLVTEFIDGPDLQAFVASGPATTSDATAVVLRILDVLQFCHRVGVLHRDIKPSNVIVRGRAPTDPVLIDFGLCFKADDRDDGFRSEADQQFGNRFLRLPEYQSIESDKGTAISDITQCVGCLFFLLTQLAPQVLRDEFDRGPHERAAAKAIIEKYSPPVADALGRIFGVGFKQHPDHRWQSIDELRSEIEVLRDPNAKTRKPSFADELKEFRETVGKESDHTNLTRAHELANAMRHAVEPAINQIHQAFDRRYSGGMLNGRALKQPGSACLDVVVTDQFRPLEQLRFELRAALENAQFVIFCGPRGDASKEMGRVGVHDPKASDTVSEIVALAILKEVQAWFKEPPKREDIIIR